MGTSRAALRLPDVAAAYVFRSKAFIEYPDKMVRFDLSQSARTEIVSFDRAGIFAEGVYQLTPPPAPSDTRKAKVANNKQRSSGVAPKPQKPMTKAEQSAPPPPVLSVTVHGMPRPTRPTDYEDEPETRVQAPLPTVYKPETRTYHIDGEEPAERDGAART